MNFFQILVLLLYITHALTKSRSRKHKASSSDEGSIENLLYYKDCQRNAKPENKPKILELRETPPPPPPPRQPECPFPKMCCTMTCGNECGGSQPATSPSMSLNNIQRFQPSLNTNPNPIGMEAVQPPIIQRRKKKMRFPINNMPTRRDFSGFTKEKIKGLISQDNDIRKILKELVRVTMQKVDLQDMINSEKSSANTVRSITSTVYSMDDYEE